MRSAAAASIFLMYPIDASVAQQQPTVKVDDPDAHKVIYGRMEQLQGLMGLSPTNK